MSDRSGAREPRGEAAEVHDPARDGGEEQRRERERPVRVGADHDLEAVGCHLALTRAAGLARVVDEHVDGPERGKRAGGDADRVQRAELEGYLLELSGRHARAQQVERRRLTARGEDDAGARSAELLGDEVTDAAAGTRNDDGGALLRRKGARIPVHTVSIVPVEAICSWWWMTSATMKFRNFSANAGSR